MLHREIIAVCSQIHTTHINTLCGQNVEFYNANWEYMLWQLAVKGLTPRSVSHCSVLFSRTVILCAASNITVRGHDSFCRSTTAQVLPPVVRTKNTVHHEMTHARVRDHQFEVTSPPVQQHNLYSTNLSITFTPLQPYLYICTLLYFNERQAMARINIEYCLCTAQLHTNRPHLNTLRTGSFKLFKRPFPGFLTILTL